MSEPFTADEGGWQPDEITQPDAGPLPQPGAPPKRKTKASANRPPGVRRRAALLAAALYMPIILLGYALYRYSPASCVAGPLCGFNHAPALFQATLSLLGFGLLYLISVRPLAAALDPRQPTRSEVARVLRQAARYETIRPLLALFGGLIPLLLLTGLITHRLSWPAGLIGLGVAALLLWLAGAAEP
jgi:hypothetical protein